MSTKRWASLITAGVLSISLTACGGDDKGTDSTGGTAGAGGAVSSSQGADAAEVTPGQEISGSEFVAMLKAPGEDKLKSYDMTLNMDVDGQTVDGNGSIDLTGTKPAMDMEMTLPGMGKAHMIMVDGRVFMAMPGLTEEGKFVEVPADQLGDMSQFEEMDVTKLWDEWEKNAKKVVFVGEEDVDGTTLKHYEVTSDVSDAIDQAGLTGDDAAAASSAMPTEMVQDIFLDEDGFMRKAELDMQGQKLTMTMDNWGEAKKVEAPAEDKIQSMDSLMGGMDGSSSTDAP